MNNQDKTPQKITPNLPLWSYQIQQNSKLAVKTRKDLEIYLITRALKDEAFRQDLVTNPKAVVGKELGTKLPEELKINVLEETEDTLYMVLPCNPYEEISEENLKILVGMTYEDVAQWVLEQQRNAFLDEENSVKMMARCWRDEAFKNELVENPTKVIEQETEEKIQQDVQIQVLVESSHILFMVMPRILDSFDELLNLDQQINMRMLMLNINLPMAPGGSSPDGIYRYCTPGPNGSDCSGGNFSSG